MQGEQKMFLYPKLYIENVTKISYDFLKQNNIKALILDMDNTLIDFNHNLLEGVDKWCENLKKNGIKLMIVSNSNKKDKIEKVVKHLNLDYILFAMKPLKKGLKQAVKKLGVNPENIAGVGDQIFTDVIGANRMHMYSILVKPLDEKDIFLTVIKRPLEKYIIKKYQTKEKNNVYK